MGIGKETLLKILVLFSVIAISLSLFFYFNKEEYLFWFSMIANVIQVILFAVWFLESKVSGSKPMSIENIEKLVIGSNANDWDFTDENGTYTYKNDVNLVIKRSKDDEGREFAEEWAEVGLHKGITAHYDIYYGISFIKKIYMVAVDGYRAYIPYPKSRTELSINLFQYKFGKIINDCYEYAWGKNNFDNYLRRLKIKIDKKKQS